MLKIDRILSVSSEDPTWPAENLLKGEGKNNKWKSKSIGERMVTVVLQLAQSSKIKSIDIGNENSAFVEILVGKSCLPDENYKVLLVASSFMSLKEAKDVSNPNAVQFFKDTNFCQPEASEKWDRIKIVCSQPYNKHIQFGLSFIKFHGESEPTVNVDSIVENKIGTLGKFILKKEEKDSIAVGSTFARRKELEEENKPKTSAVAIRAATSHLKAQSDLSPKSPKTITDKKAVNNKRNEPQSDLTVTPQRKKVRKDTFDIGAPGPSPNLVLKPERMISPASSPQPTPKKKCKPFKELLGGVVFTISGFQNPLRGDIRNKAMAMGARYVPDWNDSCSHLICAFSNTPKFNQVRGHGKIVKKDWVEESYSKRIRLPWRRYALDPSDTKKPESEDEIYEIDENIVNAHSLAGPSSNSRKANQNGPSLFGDLPNTIPKRKKAAVKDKKSPPPKKESPKKQSPKKKKVQGSNHSPEKKLKIGLLSDEPECMDMKTIYLDLNLDTLSVEPTNSELADTESDNDYIKGSDNDLCALPYLPEQFTDLSFYIASDFSPSDRADIKRYLIAHSGNVLDFCSQDTEYVIASSSVTVSKLKEKYPNIIGVKSEWIWRCHDENRLLPTSNFEL